MNWRGGVVVSILVVACVPAAGAHAADTTIDFEQPGAGTTITDQYKDVGGSGQGVVFGPLPGGAGDGSRPLLEAPGGGQTSSGTQDANIANFPGAEFPVAATTGTFAVPRSKVSVHVGYVGPAAPTCTNPDVNECVTVTLRAYNSAGTEVAASAPALLTSGAGMGTVLTAQTSSAQIVGFSIRARDSDSGKPVGIDDLAFDVPTTPLPPDFSLTPDTVNPVLRQGQTITDPITIGRFSGSSGNVGLAVGDTLPAGVHASLAPNPAGGTSSVLTLTADPGAEPTGATPITFTVTGTPSSAGVGSAARTVSFSLQVKQAFDIRTAGPADVDLSPCNVSIPFLVSRDFSLAGPVSLSVSGVANGLTASLAPSQATFPNGAAGETVQLQVRAPASGFAVPPTTLTVHANEPPLVERTATVTVHGTCPAQYDAQVTSLQITQGTQSRYLPSRDGVHAAITRYSDIPNAALLRRDGTTVVRAYADDNWGPAEGVAQVPMVLAGYYFDGNGTPHDLPGSPLLPNSGTRTLHNGPIDPTIPEMQSDTGAYTFTLPPAWTRGVVGISAQLMPALPRPDPVLAALRQRAGATAVPTARSVTPCTTAACQLNDYMALTRIPFYGAPSVSITPLQLTVGGAALPDPEDVFKWVRLTTPLQINLKPYQATIDISDIKNGNGNGDQRNSAVEDRVDDWTCDHGITAMGVNTGVARGLTRTGSWCWSGLTTYDSATVELARPLTSVAHEWYHLLGRQHASPGCGGGSNGQTAEDWPPDEMGYLQSVGLDTQLGSGKNGAPYAVVPGNPGSWFDFMSYCANAKSLTNPVQDALTLDSWISVHNWNAVMTDRAYLRTARAVRRARARAAAAPRVASLHVNATVSPVGATSILSVTPLQAPAQQASSSAYHLVAFDAAGKQLADVAMLEAHDHVDGEPPPTALNGVVPAASVASVAIVSGGATLATRTHSAHAPTISVPAVQAGARTATIRWHAADADGDALTVAIDYSTNGGASFHRIFIGPNRGSARVPARYLSRAGRARVRVVVNDGFRQATGVSKVFRAAGAAPTVRITSPAGGVRQPVDATLLLVGSAFDDRGAPITGRNLRWMRGRRLLGTGSPISAAGLAAGTQRIVLLARDGAGRAGRASVAVTLRAARPLFLDLSAPKSVRGNARSLRLRVSASLASRLVIRGKGLATQRFSVGRKARSLRVRIPRGKAKLTLKLALRAGGLSQPATLSVRRQ